MAFSLLSLPNELIQDIVDDLADDLNALKVCSIVNRRLTYSAQKHLFYKVTLRPEQTQQYPGYRGSAFLSFFEDPAHHHFACLVKHLVVQSMYEERRSLKAEELDQTYGSLPRIFQLLSNIEEIIIPISFLYSIRGFRDPVDENSANPSLNGWKSSLITALQKPTLRFIRVEKDSPIRSRPINPDVKYLVSGFFSSLRCSHYALRLSIAATELSFRRSQSLAASTTESDLGSGYHTLDLVGIATLTSSAIRDLVRVLSAVPYMRSSRLEMLHLVNLATRDATDSEHEIQMFLDTFKKSLQHLHLQYIRPSSHLYAETSLNFEDCSALKTLMWSCSIVREQLGETGTSYLLYIAKSMKTVSHSLTIEKVILDIVCGRSRSDEDSSAGRPDIPENLTPSPSDIQAWKIIDDHFSPESSVPCLQEFRVIQRFRGTQGAQMTLQDEQYESVVQSLKQMLNLMDKRGILTVEVTTELSEAGVQLLRGLQ
ncbi:hypothetical protein D9758_005549 [Tetrapyrgos nigripes]|uniref:F-box domain-containing protein n=1 Tax=Tetrapyrgos nigripes TaxID=182062 RepID=A0A8H5GH40_9AGAR|nr:hypothetical protein D9758_005549 [Tetrapyrgos nigripes]